MLSASESQAADAATPATQAKPPVARAATVKAISTRHVRAGRSARVRGKVAPAKAGRKVVLQVKTRKGWKTAKRGITRCRRQVPHEVEGPGRRPLPAAREVPR